MKKYEKVGHIHTTDHDALLDGIASRIDEYQQMGLQVEIQYQHTHAGYSALILGYLEVEK